MMKNANELSLPMEGFVRPRQVAHAFGVSRGTLYNYIKAGKIPKPEKGRTAFLYCSKITEQFSLTACTITPKITPNHFLSLKSRPPHRTCCQRPFDNLLSGATEFYTTSPVRASHPPQKKPPISERLSIYRLTPRSAVPARASVRRRRPRARRAVPGGRAGRCGRP